MKGLIIVCLGIILLAGCEPDDEPSFFKEISYFFNNDTQGWTSLFSDYPVAQDSAYELEYGMKRLPVPLDTNLFSIKVSGNNIGGDLFTCMYVPVTGLSSNTEYSVTFNVLLASDVPTSVISGPDGSPNLSIGAGGLDTIPSRYIDLSDWYRPTFDVKLQNGQSNEIMQKLGNIGVTDTTTLYTPISRNNINKPMKLKANGDGMLYLLVGWDSGYKGRTTLYIKTIIVRFEYWRK